MTHSRDQFETDRLVIRRFTPDDWAELQKLAIDKEASECGKYDHAWPTSEEGCKGMANYFAEGDPYWAVCLKGDASIIGLLALNHIGEDGTLDIGHVFHTGFVGDDHDTEALGCIIDYAFTDPDVQRIICENAEEWTVQLAPLKKLGMTLQGRGDGKDSFQKDTDGNPIEFVGCRMAITRDEWLQRCRGCEAP